MEQPLGAQRCAGEQAPARRRRGHTHRASHPRATRGARERNDRGASGSGRAGRPPAGALRPGLPVGPRHRRAVAHHQVSWRCRPQNGQRVGCGEFRSEPHPTEFRQTSEVEEGPPLPPSPRRAHSVGEGLQQTARGGLVRRRRGWGAVVRGEAQFVNFQDTAGGAGGALANRWNGPPLQIARTLSSIRDLAKGAALYTSLGHIWGVG